MPRDEKNFKRRIRARMAKTGESYTAARAQLEAQTLADNSIVEASAIFTEELVTMSRSFPARFPRVRVASTTRRYGPIESRPGGLTTTSPTVVHRGPIDHAWSGETWMEFGTTPSRQGPQQLTPSRWRENGVHEGKRANEYPTTSVLNGTTHWEDGPNGLVRHQNARESSWGFEASWVGNPFWNAHRSSLRLEGFVEVIGRRAAVVRVTPTPSSNVPVDQHQLVTVDLDSGLGLASTNFREGRVATERTVNAISFPAVLPDELFEPPDGRFVVDRQSRLTYTRLVDAVAAVPFPILVPAVLPGDVRLGHIDVVELRDGERFLHFRYHSTHAFPPLSVGIDEDSPSRDNSWPVEWTLYERGGQALLVSDTAPEVRPRSAQVTRGATRITVHGLGLTFEELIDVAVSLRPVDLDGSEAETTWPPFRAQGASTARVYETTARVVGEVASPDDPASIAGRFQLRCRELVTETRQLGFDPNVWVPMINQLGAVRAAKKLLADHHVLVATPWLMERGRPDLTLELEISQPKWQSLFSDEERSEAARRLRSPEDWPRRGHRPH